MHPQRHWPTCTRLRDFQSGTRMFPRGYFVGRQLLWFDEGTTLILIHRQGNRFFRRSGRPDLCRGWMVVLSFSAGLWPTFLGMSLTRHSNGRGGSFGSRMQMLGGVRLMVFLNSIVWSVMAARFWGVVQCPWRGPFSAVWFVMAHPIVSSRNRNVVGGLFDTFVSFIKGAVNAV